MDRKRIVICVDGDVSLLTRLALCSAYKLFGASACYILSTVIPLPYSPSPWFIRAQGVGQFRPPGATQLELEQADEALHWAIAHLQQNYAVPALACIEHACGFGVPSAELARMARERKADYMVLGSRGNSVFQNLRRLLANSISREIVHCAPCPVIQVTRSQEAYLLNPVVWYETAIARYLYERKDALVVLTPESMISMFVPPPGLVHRNDLSAAACALKHLARGGKLICHDMRGQMLYVND